MTVRIGIASDGPRVLVAIRAESAAAGGSVSLTIDLHRRGASALAAVLAARADGDEDADSEMSLSGDLTLYPVRSTAKKGPVT